MTLLCRNMPLHDVAEDSGHGFVIKLIDGDGVEMTQEARGHMVAATTCRYTQQAFSSVTIPSILLSLEKHHTFYKYVEF